jgi:hypothetical protein
LTPSGDDWARLPILASAALQRILRAAGRLKHQLWAVRSELDGRNKITAATVPPIGRDQGHFAIAARRGRPLPKYG